MATEREALPYSQFNFLVTIGDDQPDRAQAGFQEISGLGMEDCVLDAGGLERQIRIRRLPNHMDDCSLDASIEIPTDDTRDAAIWVRVTTLDGHQAWSSPIYLLHKRPPQ